ncbi:MAG: hypothetical protein GQ552_08640 [Flavobacteriaceae bacterium]|nr:hypothetical protein [Flavobacteriaceae bacterium]
MKNSILIIIALLITHQSISQDKIIKLTGESISCKVIEITKNVIRYQSIGEDVIRNFPKEKTQKIIFKNGKNEEFGIKIDIRNEKDWGKVIVTYNQSDIDGLLKGKEVSAKISSIYSSKGAIKKRTIEKIKKYAASNGYHIVLIESQKYRDTYTGGKHRVISSVVGIGYKYN